jgi:hypothetical protein
MGDLRRSVLARFGEFGILKSFLGDESLLVKSVEVIVPLDVACATDSVFESGGASVVSSDGSSHGVVIVVEEFVGEHAAVYASEEALGVDEDHDLT